MQLSEAERLREEWMKNGNKPCKHEKMVREYYRSADTGDRVCIVCGHCEWDG